MRIGRVSYHDEVSSSIHGVTGTILGTEDITGNTATITAETTSVVVTHGLSTTPTIVSVIPIDEYGIGCYVTSIGATEFTINLQGPQPSDAQFKWGCTV